VGGKAGKAKGRGKRKTMKTENFEKADIISIILTYLTLGMAVCVGFAVFSMYNYDIEENIVAIHISVGILTILMLAIRFVKRKSTKFLGFEAVMKNIIPVIISGIIFLALLAYSVLELSRSSESYLSIDYFYLVFILLVPLTLVCYSFRAVNVKSLLFINCGTVLVFAASGVLLSLHWGTDASTPVLQHVIILLPLVLLAFWCDKLFKQCLKWQDISKSVETFGAVSLFVVTLLTFLSISLAALMDKFIYVFIYSGAIFEAILLLAIPFSICYLVTKISSVRYAKMRENKQETEGANGKKSQEREEQ